MKHRRTFGQKLALGFALLVVLSLCSSVLAIYTLASVVAAKDMVLAKNARNLIDAEKLETSIHEKVTGVRGFLLTRDPDFLKVIATSRARFQQHLQRLRQRIERPASLKLITAIERQEKLHQSAVQQVIALRKTNATLQDSIKLFKRIILPTQEKVDKSVSEYVALENTILQQKTQAASAQASWGILLMSIIGLIVIVTAIASAVVLTRGLNHQIGEAVQNVLSASSELQAAATQQSSVAQEQSTAMNEISTTITELLTTSRLIAESARRVTTIAEETTASANTGDETVASTQLALQTIKQQVDDIVKNMLVLGQKSQRIGGILDIINELADQTNILAINATIEAVGAGEVGKRFGVVAEEIRKLADRVGSSTKDIRSLIEEIRSSVNTTVMATEAGMKSVETGTQQFQQLAHSFREIADRVEATHGAAQEIELSTKQQASSVDQVNVAVSNAAQAAQETEAGSQQMLQTATELATLSRELTRLIRATPKTSAS